MFSGTWRTRMVPHLLSASEPAVLGPRIIPSGGKPPIAPLDPPVVKVPVKPLVSDDSEHDRWRRRRKKRQKKKKQKRQKKKLLKLERKVRENEKRLRRKQREVRKDLLLRRLLSGVHSSSARNDEHLSGVSDEDRRPRHRSSSPTRRRRRRRRCRSSCGRSGSAGSRSPKRTRRGSRGCKRSRSQSRGLRHASRGRSASEPSNDNDECIESDAPVLDRDKLRPGVGHRSVSPSHHAKKPSSASLPRTIPSPHHTMRDGQGATTLSYAPIPKPQPLAALLVDDEGADVSPNAPRDQHNNGEVHIAGCEQSTVNARLLDKKESGPRFRWSGFTEGISATEELRRVQARERRARQAANAAERQSGNLVEVIDVDFGTGDCPQFLRGGFSGPGKDGDTVGFSHGDDEEIVGSGRRAEDSLEVERSLRERLLNALSAFRKR